MSLPTLTGTAALLGDVRTGTTRTNEPWANCVVRFAGHRKGDDGKWVETSSVVATLVAFGDTARALYALGVAKGDSIDIHARLKELTVWAPERGDPRPQLSLTLVDAARPAKRDKAPAQRGDRDRPRTRVHDDRGAGWPEAAVPPQQSGAQVVTLARLRTQHDRNNRHRRNPA